MTEIGELSPVQEDYLEIIFNLTRDRPVARVRDIARQKGVRMATVTEALKRLSREGLVQYQAREFTTLTEKGASLARRIVGRHEFLKRFFVDLLLVDEETAERDACAVEHHLSALTLARLTALYQHATACPQAESAFLETFHRCIRQGEPAEHCCEPRPADRSEEDILPLHHLKPGQAGVVVRMRATPAIRQRLVEMGLLPGVLVQMEGVAPFGDPIRIQLRGFHLSLRRDEASRIFVRRAGVLQKRPKTPPHREE